LWVGRPRGVLGRRVRGGDEPCARGETISPNATRPQQPDLRQGARSPKRETAPSCGGVASADRARLRSVGGIRGLCPGNGQAHGRRGREVGSIVRRKETSGDRIPGELRPTDRLTIGSGVTNRSGGERPRSRARRSSCLLRQCTNRWCNGMWAATVERRHGCRLREKL
jgi:hypothetical protein